MPLPGELGAPGGAPPGAAPSPDASPIGAPGAPGGAPGGGPASSPMATPQGNPGLEKAARVQVQMAVRILQQVMPAFPIESDQFKALVTVMKTLSGAFGKSEDRDRELIPAEVMQLLSGVQAQSPGAAAMARKPGIGPSPTGTPA